jgi:thiol-disulfide isomerase/thioredoxin
MSLIMIAVGMGFLYLLLHDNDRYMPRGGVEWAGSLLSGGLILSALTLMVMVRGVNPESSNVGVFQTQATTIQDLKMETPAGLFLFKGVHDGQVSDFSKFEGKVILVNFWATWCGPCKAEIPDLNRLQADYASKGLVIISISDEPRDLLIEFESQLPLATTSTMVPRFTKLPAPFTGAFNVIPSTFIIDREGKVRRYLLGARNYDFFETAVQPYL